MVMFAAPEDIAEEVRRKLKEKKDKAVLEGEQVNSEPAQPGAPTAPSPTPVISHLAPASAAKPSQVVEEAPAVVGPTPAVAVVRQPQPASTAQQPAIKAASLMAQFDQVSHNSISQHLYVASAWHTRLRSCPSYAAASTMISPPPAQEYKSRHLEHMVGPPTSRGDPRSWAEAILRERANLAEKERQEQEQQELEQQLGKQSPSGTADEGNGGRLQQRRHSWRTLAKRLDGLMEESQWLPARPGGPLITLIPFHHPKGSHAS
jgi:hypothetical protein